MAESKSRNFSIFLLILALAGATIFYGCGSATSDPIPAIEYSITGKYDSPAIPSGSTRAAAGPSVGILIYSESDPTNYADVDTTNRTYQIKNLRPGNHFIVFKHIPSGLLGTTYIGRSEKPVVLTESSPVQTYNQTLNAEESTVVITGRLRDANNSIITPPPTLTLWGQTIEVDPNTGIFTTPKMPEGTVADLIVNAINYQQTATQLVFNDNPAYQEITAVPTSFNNLPPTVTLTSKKPEYIVSSGITLTAIASDPNNDNLEFEWNIESCTADDWGSLELDEKSNSKCIYTWNAPSDSCMATISVRVYEKDTPQRLSSKAMLKLQIGSGHYVPNTVPTILDIDIYPESFYGNREYTITNIATDTDGDVLYHFLTISPGGSRLTKIDSNAWTWKTPDLSEPKAYTLDFEVKDKKGHTASTSIVIDVQATRPNNPPIILSRNPAEGTAPSLTSGVGIELSLSAMDPENERLLVTWSCTSGEITGTFQENGNASATWVAPILNAPAIKEIYARVKDSSGDSVTATYTINVIPDPNKKAPEVELTISGTSDTYNGSIPLFKTGDTISFSGIATDSNNGTSIINDVSYTWHLIRPDGTSSVLARGSKTATFKTNNHREAGDYVVRLVAVDIQDIEGEKIKDFRVNTLPASEIICNGNYIGTDGRMSTPTQYKHSVGGKIYDVFQIGEPINMVASCSDIETAEPMLGINARWILNESSTMPGKHYSPASEQGVLNTVQMYTTDSKGEGSATSTYSFFLNKPPVFETATSTKSGFISTDIINLNAKVKDDANGIELAWFYSYKVAGGGSWSPYAIYPVAGYNPTSTPMDNLTSTFQINASDLIIGVLGGSGGDFRFRLIATDSMGVSVANNDIAFAITEPHEIKDFVLASGTYSDSGAYTSFEALPLATPPYIFGGKAPFSIRSGSNKWQEDMTWTWYDIYWQNGQPGAPQTISTGYVDGYTLNGYKIDNNFGTHSIRLEGKSNEFGIVASKSVDILINSVPSITFTNTAEEGITRFDTDGGATFTLALKEDNPNEKLGLTWSIVKLDESFNPIATHTFVSHDLNSSTGSISSVSMNGSNNTNVTVTLEQLLNLNPTPPSGLLASGALKVYACAYDAYGAAATATLDVLLNRLPTFNDVPGTNRKINITVPAICPDNNDNYQYFVEQYATASKDIPVYLTEGLPSMYLNFEVEAFDYELNECGLDINTYKPENITWNYTDSANQQMTASGKTIGARFSIGLNTIRVEVKDSFYGKYNGRFDKLTTASYTAQFYVWHSQSQDLVNDYYTATDIFPNGNGCFYVQLKDFTGGGQIASYTERYQLKGGAATSIDFISPGSCINEIYTYKLDGNEYKRVGTLTPGILSVVPTRDNKILHLTNTEPLLLTNYIKLDNIFEQVATYTRNLKGNALVYLGNSESNDDNQVLSSLFRDGMIPGAPPTIANQILSMTYSSSIDTTGGAFLVKGWPTGKDSIGIYANNKVTITPSYTPVFKLDNKDLSLTGASSTGGGSKVRCISSISGLAQQLFVTDTGNNRVIKLNSDLSGANSINVTSPIDITSTANKYLFTLSGAGEKAVNLYAVDNASATVLASFCSFASAADRGNRAKRAGKVLNPKAIYYYTTAVGTNHYGGLLILEEGLGPNAKSRVQLIRSNLKNWID